MTASSSYGFTFKKGNTPSCGKMPQVTLPSGSLNRVPLLDIEPPVRYWVFEFPLCLLYVTMERIVYPENLGIGGQHFDLFKKALGIPLPGLVLDPHLGAKRISGMVRR